MKSNICTNFFNQLKLINMSKSMKGGLYGRRKRALARLEIALEAADPKDLTRVNRMKSEIKTLQERLAGK